MNSLYQFIKSFDKKTKRILIVTIAAMIFAAMFLSLAGWKLIEIIIALF